MNNALSDFADKLIEIMSVIVKEFIRYQVKELYKGEVTMSQFLILNFLDKNGDSKMTELANFMEVSTAAATGMVERLVKSGYAVRITDPQDRRIIKIRLTSKGKGLVKRVMQQRRQMVIEIFGKLPPAERTEYLKILADIRDILLKRKEARLK